MIERKLSNPQVRIFMALSGQRMELQKQFQEILDAEKEQIEMLRKHFELPEGEYQIRQEPTGDVIMFLVEPEKEAEKPKEKVKDEK